MTGLEELAQEDLRLRWLLKPRDELGGTVTPPREAFMQRGGWVPPDEEDWDNVELEPLLDTVPEPPRSSPTRTVQLRNLESPTVLKRKMAPDEEMNASFEKFGHSTFADVVCLEIFAGSARLTAELSAVGFDSLAIDHAANKHRQLAPVLQYDLTVEADRNRLLELLDNPQVMYVHIAMPCGTASKAREIPMASWKLNGRKAPGPLRSPLHPEGLPNLSGLDKTRVSQANMLYDFSLLVMKRCLSSDVYFTCENPRSSYLWQYLGYPKLLADPRVQQSEFQNCMHGGSRDKWSKWAGTLPNLSSLDAKCDGKHGHLAWGMTKDPTGKTVFATSQEAAYPRVLCQTVAKLVAQAAEARGFIAPATLLADVARDPVQKKLFLRASTGLLPRSKKLPQLLSEFREVVPCFSELEPGQKFENHLGHCKVLRRLIGDEKGAANYNTGPRNNCMVGVYRNELEFLTAASTLEHPMDSAAMVPDVLVQSLFDLLTLGAEAISERRMATLKDLIIQAKRLQPEDARIFAQMCPDVKKVLRGKRLALWQYLIDKYDYPDKNLVREVAAGFELTGMAPRSDVFPSKLRPAMMTAEAVKKSSVWIRDHVASQVRASGSQECDQAVWKATLEEIDNSWLIGPLSSAEIDSQVGSKQWVVSKRFGLLQGGKYRPIDDYTASYVNAAMTTTEKLDLGGTDDVANLLKMIAESIPFGRLVKLRKEDGSFLEGQLHESFKDADHARSFMGRTLDLKAAYRQLAISPNSRWCSLVAIHNPVLDRTEIYRQVSLPFGSTSSVYCFNRASRSLWWLASRALGVLWSNYFDDFPMLEHEMLAPRTSSVVECFLHALGWSVSMTEEKRKPMALSFDALGVTFNLDELHKGAFAVSNKVSRTKELVSCLRAHVESGSLTPGEASELAGRLQYSSGQVMGRLITGLLDPLYLHARAPSLSSSLPLTLLDSMVWVADHLEEAAPRRFGKSDIRVPVLVFTDGACEGDSFDVVTVGAVLVDPFTGRCEYFGLTVPDQILKIWRTGDKLQTIGQAEIFPVSLARFCWAKYLDSRRALYFVDNDAARLALIKARSPAPASNQLVRSFLLHDAKVPSWPWFARVPSPSNIGDGPSRLDYEAVQRLPNSRLLPEVFLPGDLARLYGLDKLTSHKHV